MTEKEAEAYNMKAKDRYKAKRTTNCPRCGAKAGDRCLDLRPRFKGRKNKHIHRVRELAWLLAKTGP